MINFIASEGSAEGVASLSENISNFLNDGKRVLWLIAGGSNIPIAVRVMTEIRKKVETELLKNLVITQTDERYGPVGHADSNWQGMINAGFDFEGIETIPVLDGLSLDETVRQWSERLEMILRDTDVHIGQFGMGADGHIAGILPQSRAVHGENLVAVDKDVKFTRITIAPITFKQLTSAYAFVFGDSKKEAVRNLREKDLSLEVQPAQVLKIVPEVYFYTA